MKYQVLALVLLTAVRPALAQRQCPDGTPPPCRRSPAPSPPLDPNRWLVIPFENRTAHPDSALLREGTATLLRLELERWPELSIVDEAAVADELRRLQLEGRAVGLEQARAIARAFGAGNIVLGQVVPGPHSVRVLARAYSTRTGRRTREGTVITPTTDSAFTSAMGGVAAGLLNLPQASDAQGPAVGTQSLAAYREYVLGRIAGNRLEGNAAFDHFRRAIALDSTFALAYYASFWAHVARSGTLAPPQGRPMALAAQRHAATLPLRERRKIAAAEAQSRGVQSEACRLNAQLLASDGTDADVLRGLNWNCCCNAQVVPDPRSPSGFAFTTSLQTYFWAARRVLEGDTTNEGPYAGVFSWVVTPLRMGCLADAVDVCPLDKVMSAWVLVDHDTLSTVPWPVGGFRRGRPVGDTTSAETVLRATRAKLEMLRPLLERWRASFPDSRQQRARYANFLQQLGQPELALPVVLDFASPRGTEWPLQLNYAVGVLWQLDRPREAGALYDSLRQAATAALARGDSSLVDITSNVGDNIAVALGRIPPAWATLAPEVVGYSPVTDQIRRTLGLGPDSLLPFEADSGRNTFRFRPENVGPDGRPNATGIAGHAELRLYYSIVGFHDRRTLLVADTVDRPPWGLRDLRMASHPYQVFQVRLASGDTAGARELLRRADYQLLLGAPSHPWLSVDHLFVAESYLELGDSAAALERLRDYARKFPRSLHFPLQLPFLPRFWIRYGDLAYAMHQRDEAIRAYRFISELWADADPLFQPTVQRARTRLAELAGRTNN